VFMLPRSHPELPQITNPQWVSANWNLVKSKLEIGYCLNGLTRLLLIFFIKLIILGYILFLIWE
jgi:hypothetical protein